LIFVSSKVQINVICNGILLDVLIRLTVDGLDDKICDRIEHK